MNADRKLLRSAEIKNKFVLRFTPAGERHGGSADVRDEIALEGHEDVIPRRSADLVIDPNRPPPRRPGDSCFRPRPEITSTAALGTFVPFAMTLPVERLRKGKIRDRERIRQRRENFQTDWSPRTDIFPTMVCSKPLCEIFNTAVIWPATASVSPGTFRLVTVVAPSRNVVRVSIGQIELLPQDVAGIDHAVSVCIQKFLDDDFFAVGQAGHLKRHGPAVGVADGRGRDGHRHRGAALGCPTASTNRHSEVP